MAEAAEASQCTASMRVSEGWACRGRRAGSLCWNGAGSQSRRAAAEARCARDKAKDEEQEGGYENGGVRMPQWPPRSERTTAKAVRWAAAAVGGAARRRGGERRRG